MWYAFDENFVLPLSHDEVVHMKGSLIRKMPGDDNQKYANLRALFAYMTAHPGKKLLFMGGEFAQWREWNYEQSLDWHLLENPCHRGIQRLVADLNGLYKTERALYLYDEKHAGFEWIDDTDYQHNVLAFLRKSDREEETILVVCNFADTVYHNYRVGMPIPGRWQEIFNSQYKQYEGWDITNPQPIETEAIECHGRKYSLNLQLPPLGVSFFKLV
jgi:1,4-alpha-glucan branching enzyme